ncbi:MAG: hypothetical protein LBC97_12530 [Bifidobacteriaceae bacterium]|jgi:hypothetical protein|nr:hypothetical protein [Bifidobacteriaceae bacterium]
MAAVISESLDAAQEGQFWRQVAATMPAGGAAATDVELLDSGLADGLDPAETWDDVL